MGLDLYFERRKTVGYFRKVNFLVGFFENLGLNVENQDSIYVSKENVLELIERCKLVLENRSLAEVLLPVTEGFFFGSTDYDNHYFNDVKDVLEYCNETLLPMYNELEDNESIYFTIWY